MKKIAIKPEGEPAFTATVEGRSITITKPNGGTIESERASVGALRQEQADRRREQAALENRVQDFRGRHGRDPHDGEVVTPQYRQKIDWKRDSEEPDFSLARLIRSLTSPEGRPTGAEAEWAQEGRREATASGIFTRAGSVLIPDRAFERRDLTATGGTGLNQGGQTVQTQKTRLLDSLFSDPAVARAGATVMSDLVGNLDVPRIIPGTDPSGKTENAQADEYNPTTEQVSFSPNRLPTYVDLSNQLLIQSRDRDLEGIIRRHLRRTLGAIMDKAFLNGSGTNAAEGILQTSGIGNVVAGPGAVTWEDIVNLAREVGEDDADTDESGAFITNHQIAALLRRTPKISSTDSKMILEPGPDGIERLMGRRVLISSNVPSDLASGSYSNLSAMIFGNFTDYMVGYWSGIEFLVNPYSKDTEGITRVNASVYYDGHVVRPQSFAAILDAVTS